MTVTKRPIQSRSRVANALLAAAKGFIISAAKTFYALWLEVTGLLFAVFTVAGASDLIRHYRADHLADHKRLLVVAGSTLVCAWFTVLSFVKARRTRK
jgi:hypothetical protein